MTTHVCGTGNWSGPLPGDPDNTSILTATSAFGGIDISWTLPGLNPHAVAYVILYRGTSGDFNLAVQRATVGGNHFYDRIDSAPILYYYWIRIVSINGTPGELIGPASATPRSAVGDIIEGLTGQIDAGVLAQSLKTDIDNITLFGQDLIAEIQNRIAADDTLGATIGLVQTDMSTAMTWLQQEITQRTEADDALVSQVNVMAAGVNDNAAAILTEHTVRANEAEALAKAVGYLYAQVGLDLAAAIDTSAEAQAGSDGAYADLVTTAQVVVENDMASVQTTQSANITTLDGKVTSIGALYTAKVQVNGLIGGFGVYNDGTEVEAGFDVDRFWVGRTGPDKKKPFIIQDDIVYIDNALINQLTADKIDSRGLSIKDMNGNVILSAANPLDWGQIGGTGKPENNATVGAPAGTTVAGTEASALVATASVASARAISRPNLLFNGGFEFGAKGWFNTTGFQFSDGTWGRSAVRWATEGTGTLYSDRIPAVGGEWYTISGDSVLYATSGSVYFDLLFYSAADVLLLDGPQNPKAATHDFSNTDANRSVTAVEAQAPSGTSYCVARFVWANVVGGTAVGCRQVQVERGRMPYTSYTADASNVAALTNFNAANDRNGNAIDSPNVATNGTAVDHTLQVDGSADISFEWSWSGVEGDIDGFLVFTRQSSSAAAYTFGSSPAEETTYMVPADKRALFLYGVAADKYYSFAVQAYRSVDKDVAAGGAIKSTLVKATGTGENPYRPSASVAFSGDVTGTVNSIPAGNVNNWTYVSNKSGLAALVEINSSNVGTALALKVIGGAYIDDAAVNTLTIAGEAVTVPRAATTAGTTPVATTWADVQTLDFPDAGVPVIVMGKITGFHGNEGSYTDYEVRILNPSGAVLDSGGGRVEGVQTSGVAIAVMAKTTGAGTYKLQAKGDLGTVNPVGNRSLVLIGCKR